MRCSVDDGMSDACAVVVAAEHAVVHGRAALLAVGERFAGTTADARTMERGCLVHMSVQEVAHCVGSRVPWRYTETGRFFPSRERRFFQSAGYGTPSGLCRR